MSNQENEKIVQKNRAIVVDPLRRKSFPKTNSSGSRPINPGDKGSIWEERSEGNLSIEESQEPERVRVTIRVRPFTAAEIESEAGAGLDVYPEKNTVVLLREEAQEFKFDAVLPSSATQAEVYNVAARPVIYDVLNGYNGTVMAYGQTGAGKTYTLSSTVPHHLGIIPRASAEIFTMARLDKENIYRVSMSYIQIYMEMIQDLLRPSSVNMQIRESENGVYISGVEEVEVRSVEDCLKLLSLGERNRAFAFTKLNAHSSRSHAIAIFTIEKKSKEKEDDYFNGDDDSEHAETETESVDFQNKTFLDEKKLSKEKILVGKLFLVDLAGSERLKKSGSEGVRASEAKSVNLSLTCLGKCINARADPNSTHVPFRDSKLTRLLQESLGGNAKTSLVINVASSADHTSESLSSLLFGSRAMKVKTKAVINEEDEYKLLSRNLQETIDFQEDRVHSLEVVVYSQEEQLAQAKYKLDYQIAVVDKLNQEKEELVRKFQNELAEKDKLWEARIRMAEIASQQNIEEAQQQYRNNLAQTVESLNAQREGLLDSLKKSRDQITLLEIQVKKLEKFVQKEADENLEKYGFDKQQLAEAADALSRAEEENAARVIQRAFRQYRLDKIMTALTKSQKAVEKGHSKIKKLVVENKDLQVLANAAGHKMVSASLHNISSLLNALNLKFLSAQAFP